MIEDHPITPPPELVQQWIDLPLSGEEILVTAYRAGADQELEACCLWMERNFDDWDNRFSVELRAARRPKPPSLKEQALDALHGIHDQGPTPEQVTTIRRALEQLDD
jgi:hypothetical protein